MKKWENSVNELIFSSECSNEEITPSCLYTIYCLMHYSKPIVMPRSFWTDSSVQVVQTQTWLLRTGLIRVYTVCHSVCIIWTHYPMVNTHCSLFWWLQQIFRVPVFLGFFRYTLMIRNRHNQTPHPAPKTKREITKHTNRRQSTKGTRSNPNEQLPPKQAAIQLPKIYKICH